MRPIGRAGYNYFMVVRGPVGPNNAPGALLIEPTLHTHIPRTVSLGSGFGRARHLEETKGQQEIEGMGTKERQNE